MSSKEMMASDTVDLFTEATNLPWSASPTPSYVQVAFNRPLLMSFSYSVPEALVDRVQPGKRILAPFGRGNQTEVGFCVEVRDEPGTSAAVKSIVDVLDEQPLLSTSMMRLTRWMAGHYYCGWGQVLDAVIPRAVKENARPRLRMLIEPVSEPDGDASLLTVKQKQAYVAVLEMGRPATLDECVQASGVGSSVLRTLIKKGWLIARPESAQPTDESVGDHVRTKPMTLNPYQKSAHESIGRAIADGTSGVFLLHGVTGSGKTEVYLQSIADVVKRGREAIVLVPEISLTPQTIERFQSRFDSIAILHSHLSDPDRSRHWQRIRDGQVQVVIGARSALFAPCRRLGLIVIDEEHETTFKQETTPRYHARDVAIERGRIEDVPVVLGSATPSLESWSAATRGEIRLLSIPERVVGLSLPKVQCVDMRDEYRRQRGLASISPRLAEAVRECLDQQGQVILLLNRRGFAPAILCPQCGHVERCQHCDIAMTFHKSRSQAVCHFCDSCRPAPRTCSQCQHRELRFAGFGTQRLEDEVRARFPNARIARMDSDTMRSASHYQEVLSGFRDGSIDLLLGTQMIAKGLDFPNVRLVGVISADTARNVPDFRASEKTFQLIVQVSGRAGRGNDPGRVLVQSFNPDDPAIQLAIRSDYANFVRRELAQRQEFGYPPAKRLTRVIVRSKQESTAREGATAIAHRLAQDEFAPRMQILGPSPAPVARLRDYFRYHLQFHTDDDQTREAVLRRVFDDLSLPSTVEYVVDVDPVDLL